MSARTVHNRHMSLRAFLLSLGLDAKTVPGKAPRYDKTLPEIFEPGGSCYLFRSLSAEYDRLLFGMLLKTGLREREVMHLEWTDISSSGAHSMSDQSLITVIGLSTQRSVSSP